MVQFSDWFTLTLLLLLCFILLFWHQAALSMQAWDESRLANNALEMVHSRNWMVPQYDGLPDHWNTKPPLMIWAIASLMRLGGPPLLALRAPSFFAVAATIALTWGFCTLTLRDRLAGAISVILLITSGLYAGPHVARTGDYDALLTFFILLYSLAFWIAIEGSSLRLRWIGLATVAISLAILTKGIAALMPLPGLLAFAVVRGKVIMMMRSWQVWAMATTAISVGLGYYFTREIYDPGYILSVLNNEIWGPFNERNSYTMYYIDAMLGRDPVLLSLLLLGIFPLLGQNFRARSVIVFSLLFSTFVLLVLMLAREKHYWYLAPIYPPLAIAAALGFSNVLRHIYLLVCRYRPQMAELRLQTILVGNLIAACIFFYPLSKSLTEQVDTAKGYPHYNAAQFFEGLQKTNVRGQVTLVVNAVGGADRAEYNPIAKFYKEFFNQHEPKINVVPPSRLVLDGGQMATCDRELKPLLKGRPGFQPSWEAGACLFGQVDQD